LPKQPSMSSWFRGFLLQAAPIIEHGQRRTWSPSVPDYGFLRAGVASLFPYSYFPA
jgi:hypothetical protein